jgi:toxin ParE1/3/4
VAREVVYSLDARDDLRALFQYIAAKSGSIRARNFIGRIERTCESLSLFSERGTRRDDKAPGLRTIGLARRVTIIFRVTPDRVQIIKIAYAGRDWMTEFGQGNRDDE